jgi:hypothetical protein
MVNIREQMIDRMLRDGSSALEVFAAPAFPQTASHDYSTIPVGQWTGIMPG